MKKLIYTFLILTMFFFSDSCFSQNPTYNLTAKNFSMGSVNSPNDALYFDVYIEWTNPGIAPNFELAGSQLYFSFNRAILSIPPGVWPPTGGAASPDTTHFGYKIVGSDIPTAMQPRNNSLYTATSPTADIMRGAINTFPGAGFGTNIPAGFPGVKIARYRLWNKNGTFNAAQLNIAWRNPPVVAYTTKVFAYVGSSNTDITTSATHAIEFCNEPLPNITYPCAPFYVNLLDPPDNSINVSYNPTFRWNKYPNTSAYNLQISTDSNFTSMFYLDSAITDTFKTVLGFNSSTKYYWKIISKDTSLIYRSSETWEFTTSAGITLNLKFIPEGLYSSLFNLLYRKDTVKVYLRDASPPYSFIDSAINRIDSISFSANYSFQNAPTGTYYIVTKHLNSLETWSKSGGQYLKIDSSVNYDFTSAASQAYGNNLKLRGSKYCAYAGDLDHDGFIDGNDLSRIDNDSYIYLSGNNLPADLNGDGIVDGIDFLIGDNNWQYITVKSPIQISDAGFKYRVSKYYEP